MAGNERNNDDQINAKDFLIGALVGGVVGSLAALLLAPKAGKELRHDIHNQTDLLWKKTDQLRSTAMEKGTDLSSTVVDRTTALSRKVSEQSVDLVKKVKGLKGEKENKNPVDELFEKDSQSEIQRKLEETKKAFDETESKFNH